MCSFTCKHYTKCPIKYRVLGDFLITGNIVLSCEELVSLFLAFIEIKELSKLPLELEKDS